MSGKQKRRPKVPQEIAQVFEKIASQVAEGVVAGLERSGIFNKLLERIQTAKADAAAAEAKTQSAPSTKLPPIALKPEVALELLREKAAAKREALLARKITHRRVVRPTVTYRTNPRAADAETPDSAKPIGLPPSLGERPSLLGGPLPPPPPLRSPLVSKNKGGTRGVFALLYEEKGRKVLAGLINQLKLGRSDLITRLNEVYQGMPGVPLQEEDVLRVVHYHKLTEVLHRREAEIICRILQKMRGSLAKTAQKLKIGAELLHERIRELKLEEEVSRIRQQFCEEILEHMTLAQRLELALTKAKYLADLNVEQQVDALIKRDLKEKLDELQNVGNGERGRLLCREMKLDENLADRLMRRYGQSDRAAGEDSISAPHSI